MPTNVSYEAFLDVKMQIPFNCTEPGNNALSLRRRERKLALEYHAYMFLRTAVTWRKNYHSRSSGFEARRDLHMNISGSSYIVGRKTALMVRSDQSLPVNVFLRYSRTDHNGV
jgi:hypothetical protein